MLPDIPVHVDIAYWSKCKTKMKTKRLLIYHMLEGMNSIAYFYEPPLPARSARRLSVCLSPSRETAEMLTKFAPCSKLVARGNRPAEAILDRIVYIFHVKSRSNGSTVGLLVGVLKPIVHVTSGA